MYTITDKQLNAMKELKLIELSETLAKYITERFFLFQEVSEKKLISEIKLLINLLESYGITSITNIQTYVELNYQYKEVFVNPLPNWITDILSWPNRAPFTKLFLLKKELTINV